MNKPKKKYKGVIIPMVTPMNNDFSIDKESVERLTGIFINTKVDPFVLGTTGESVSLSARQKQELVKTTASCAKSGCTIYAGISGNSLHESIEEALNFFDMGVHAVVAHLPFYFPLSDDQMLRYYEQLANSMPCPLFLYNNPITTRFSIPLSVIEELSYHPNIVGIKDSERGMERLQESVRLWSGREDFSHLLGWAAQSAYALLQGSDGIVPSTGNITPGFYRDLYDYAMQGNELKTNELQEKTNRISEIYQKNKDLSHSLPTLKLMMSYYGMCKPNVMPPLYPLDKHDEDTVKEAMMVEMGTLI